MAVYLVIYTDNHGEEFDVNGFKIMTKKEIDNYEDLANSITWEFVYYANSECLTYSNGEDFLSRIEFKEISKDEFKVIEKVFGGEFGTFIGEEYLKNILDGEVEHYEEDESDDY
jgi:hypothetical protein